MKNKTKLAASALIIAAIWSPALFGQEQTTTTVTTTTTTDQPVAPPTSYSAFTKGSNVLNLGVGMGGYYTYWGDGYAETPNFVVSYDNGTFGNVGPGTISLGGLFSYKGISDDYIGGDGFDYHNTWSYWILGLRSAYHLNIPSAPKLDLYGGLMLGYYFLGHTFSTNNPNYTQPGNPGYVYYTATYPSYAALSMYVGARYYLSNTVGIWGELGYGYTTFALGVNFKI